MSPEFIRAIIMAVLIVVVGLLFLYVVFRRYQLIRLGQYENRFDQPVKRIINGTLSIFGQGRVLRWKYAGVLHFFIFWGFIVLLTAIIDMITQSLGFSIPFIRDNPYLFLLQDIVCLMVILGLIMAAVNRYIRRPKRFEGSSLLDASIILILIFFVIVTLFIERGTRILLVENIFRLDMFSLTFLSNFVANIFSSLSFNALNIIHQIAWWAHILIIFGFLVYIPSSKHMHLMACPINEYFRSYEIKGVLRKMDIDVEEAETFGVSKVNEFTWKQLLDSYACTECGRCQDNCPAYQTEKPLSPKILHVDLKEHLLEVGPELVKKGEATEEKPQEKKEGEEKALIGGVFSEEFLWACTTCRACQEQCPVYNEHIQKIVDMRRYLVLMEGSFPSEAQLCLRNMENNSNPWGISFMSRADWAQDLEVKKIADNPEAELLYWVGCAGSFDDRNIKVAKAMVNILKAAGINFTILGTEEKCCGDSARRIGNEYLYQTLVQENIANLKKYNVKRIVTTCPHCFNTLKNEYPQFDGNFEVVHHTEFIDNLLNQGKISLKKSVEKKLAYHDSCYLGRYNDIYEQPRRILGSVPGLNLVEIERRRANSFCCGAGGGRMWMEESIGQRINVTRFEEAMKEEPEGISTACPFCLSMFDEASKIKEMEEKIKIYDIAEIVSEAL